MKHLKIIKYVSYIYGNLLKLSFDPLTINIKIRKMKGYNGDL